jgi:hypothetical protein
MGLSVMPVSYAMALMVVLLLTVIGPRYNIPVASLGTLPSVV